MKILLDTHAFLWAVSGDSRLSATASASFCDSDNELHLSAISYWEICIKNQIGKLPLSDDWIERLDDEVAINGIHWLEVRKEHCQRFSTLPMIHRDPFDRLLIAQALHERMTLLTKDDNIRQYAVATLW